jgi:sodium/proline symporter|tara:strand:- start:596 stop:2131 length:1536 start_codon:yes stop_codon:yes gene_type:complete
MVYVALACYFVVLVSFGVVAARRISTVTDYYLGGKRLSYWVAAFSARATGESAWLYLGLTGLGATVGLSALWVVAGELLGVAGAWFLMASPFKLTTDRENALTIPDYLIGRFAVRGIADRWVIVLRSVAVVALAGFVTIYVSAQLDATGKAFAGFLDWNYYVGIAVGFAIVMAYTSWGGFLAVAWSDVFQGIMMAVGLVALPIGAIVALGGMIETQAALAVVAPGMLTVWGDGGFTWQNVLTVISYVAIGLGFLGSPQIFVRFMAIRDLGEIRRGRWVALVFTLLTDTGAVMSGFLGSVLLVGDRGGQLALLGVGGELVLPLLTQTLFPPLIVGCFVAAVLAATMSTIDSLLVVASSAVTHDVYKHMPGRAESSDALMRMSRRVTIALGLCAFVMALGVSVVAPDRTIFWYVIFGWSGLTATFCPMMILSLAWPRYNVYGAITSMISGIVSVPFFAFVVPALPGRASLLVHAEELAPSFLVSLLCGIVVTLLTRDERQQARATVAIVKGPA